MSAAVGFIALLGQVSLAGLLVLSAIEKRRRRARRSARRSSRAPSRGSARVLMTALLAMLGLCRWRSRTGVGSETQRPFALVIVGGMVTTLPGGALRAAGDLLAHRPGAPARPTPSRRRRRSEGWQVGLVASGFAASAVAQERPALEREVTVERVVAYARERAARTRALRSEGADRGGRRRGRVGVPEPHRVVLGLRAGAGQSEAINGSQHQVWVEQPILLGQDGRRRDAARGAASRAAPRSSRACST